MLSEREIEQVADGVLKQALQGYGYEYVVVRSGVNFDDEPALFIDAVLDEGIPPLPGDVLSHAAAAVRRALLGRDEERFPYLSMFHPDDTYADEDSKQARLAQVRRAHG
ncbi:MAG: hypothetical protein ACLPN5_21070 [Roseiarcus sp.]